MFIFYIVSWLILTGVLSQVQVLTTLKPVLYLFPCHRAFKSTVINFFCKFGLYKGFKMSPIDSFISHFWPHQNIQCFKFPSLFLNSHTKDALFRVFSISSLGAYIIIISRKSTDFFFKRNNLCLQFSQIPLLELIFFSVLNRAICFTFLLQKSVGFGHLLSQANQSTDIVVLTTLCTDKKVSQVVNYVTDYVYTIMQRISTIYRRP